MLKTTIIFFAALFISGWPSQVAAQTGGPDIRGTVSRVSRKEADNPDKVLIGTLLIEGTKEADTQLDKAVVRVSDETAIFEMRGGERRRVSFDALKVGQRVEARFTGPVLRSYPAQARASEIVILEEPSSSGLVDPTHPKAVAGQRGWGYHRSASVDLDGDGTREKIYLVANVSLKKGRPLWDDGQIWQVYVEGPSGVRTYLYSRFVQLGRLEVMVTPAEQGSGRNLLIIERTPYSMGLYEIRYLGRGEVRSVELVRRTVDPSVNVAQTPTRPFSSQNNLCNTTLIYASSIR
jgi:hypothetical protein